MADDERSPDDELPLDLADAVLEGKPLDWQAASAKVTDSQRPLLAHLQAVAGIASFGLTSSASERLRAATVEDLAGTPELSTWGPLTILARIGRGSFGDVYRARDPKLDRPVALKLLRHRDHSGDADETAAIAEGRLMAKVHHPGVVTVYGAERIDGRVGIWMQLVDGRTLELELAERGPFPESEATQIGLDLCGALSAIHKAGLIHRDLKAQNVLRDPEGQVMVTDFGAGRALAEIPDGEMGITGTPLYLAPEVLDGALATARSDIYSLGVLLFHLVTGSYPVKGQSVAEIRAAHREKRRSRLRDAAPQLSARFMAAVERALESDPARRFGTAREFESALSPPASSFGRPFWALAATLMLALAGVAYVIPGPWKVDSLRGGVVSRQLPSSEWASWGGASADDRLFTFIDSTMNVAVMDLASGVTRRLTTDASPSGEGGIAQSPVLSTDGRLVATAWWSGGGYELRVIDVESQESRRVKLSPSIKVPSLLEWTRDGEFVLSMLTRPDRSNELALLSVADGAIQPIVSLGGVTPQHVSLSPDGRFVVYDFPKAPASSDRDIFIVGRDGSDPRPLSTFPSADVGPVWAPDGAHVVFQSDRSGAMDLWSIEVEDGRALGEPEPVRRNLGRVLLLGVTDSGGYYYQQTVGAVDVYNGPLSGDTSKPEAISTSYSGSNISSLWSPDGRQVAFASRRGRVGFAVGWTVLVIRDLENGEQRELTPPMNSFLLRSWAPDGRHLLVQGEDAQGRTGIHSIDAATGDVSPMVLNDSGQNDIRRPDWRPDGRVVYLNGKSQKLLSHDVASSREEVLVDLKSGAQKIFANIMGRGFRLSPDGRTLAYTVNGREDNVQNTSLWIRPFRGGSPKELVQVKAPETLMFQDWTPDGRALLFTRWSLQGSDRTMVSLFRVPLEGGEPESLELTRESLRDVSVHPDGTRITFTAGNPRAEIWVLENLLAPSHLVAATR